MRVTDQSMVQSMLYHLRQRLSGIDRYQTQLSTAKRINVPSDDPNGTRRALQMKSRLAASVQYQRNAFDAEAWAERSDGTIQSVHDVLLSARDLVQQGSSDTLGPDERAAIASQIDAALEDIISLANTRYEGRYLFTGVGTGGPAVLPSRTIADETFSAPLADQPFELDHAGLVAGSVIVTTLDGSQTFVEGDDYVVDAEHGTITVLSSSTSIPPMAPGTTYLVDYETVRTSTVAMGSQADGVSMLRQVRQDVTYDVVMGASQIFTGGVDVFAALVDARDALERDDPLAILDAFEGVEDTLDHVLAANQQTGTLLDRIFRAQEELAKSELALTAELSAVEETDMAQAIVALRQEELTYQAILQIVQRSVVEPSLLNFLS